MPQQRRAKVRAGVAVDLERLAAHVRRAARGGWPPGAMGQAEAVAAMGLSVLALRGLLDRGVVFACWGSRRRLIPVSEVARYCALKRRP